MKKLIFMSVFFLLIAAQTVSADVFFQPQFSTINVGDPLTVDVMISRVSDPWLAAYNLKIGFNPTILPLVAVAWPDHNLGLPTLRDAIFGTGLVTVKEGSPSFFGFDPTQVPYNQIILPTPGDLAAIQSGNSPFRLFELVFGAALLPGTSTLTFEEVILEDYYGNPLTGQNYLSGSVTVAAAAVPEPSTMLLLGSGLLGLVGYGRRKFFKK